MEIKTLPIPIPQTLARYLFLGLASASFAIPFSLGHSQIITGVLVNATLFVSAALLPPKLFWPVIVLPGLAVLSRGVIFGPLTPFLIYFLPFIWLGNFGLMAIFKKTLPVIGYFPTVLIASISKALFLYSFSSLFLKFGLVPKIFLTTMGMNQLITACLGGLLAYMLLKKTYHNNFYGKL